MAAPNRRTLRLALAALAALLPLSGARASRQLPGQVENALGLGYSIQCSLCHVEGKTGNGAALTPFAVNARAHGMTGSGGGGRGGISSPTSNIATTLAKLATDQVDSDGDGVTDIDELKAGHDPNVFGPVPLQYEPAYGCTSARGIGLWALVALAVFVWIRTRRQRAGK